MKKRMVFLLLSALLLTACGQTPYSPAVITSSQLELSSPQPAEETMNIPASAVLPVESENLSVGNNEKSSAASSKSTSSKINPVSSSASSILSALSSKASSSVVSSQQSSSSDSVISSAKSSVTAVVNSQNIQVESLTSPITRGQDAKITIKGKPDVEYTIKVIYKSGPSTAKGLEPKICELNGLVSWSWKVSSRTTAGDWSIEISGDGESITVPFIVN